MKDETPPLTKAEVNASSAKDPKPELMKKEEDSPQHYPMLCPPVSAVPDKTPTTSTTPPPKAPPVSHTSYRNLSTRNTPQTNLKPTPTQPAATPPHTTSAPPSTTSSTSTEDPVILTTNVPILPKARPGHPPINTTWVGPPQWHHASPYQQHLHASPIQVTIPRPHRNGQLLPFNFSNDVKHYLNPTAHPTRRPVTSQSRTTNSLQPNHYHQHHYSIPTSTSYSRCATNRAAGGHAPTNYPADCAPSRCCSRGRAQLTPQQLIVSPCTFTQRVMTKKNATSVQFSHLPLFVFSTFSYPFFLDCHLFLTSHSHRQVCSIGPQPFFKLVIVTCNRAPPPHLAVNGAALRL